MKNRVAQWGLMMGILLGIASGRLCAQEAGPREYQVKAFMLVNFANFVDWPENAFAAADAPFVIGILGKDPFGEDLEKAVVSKTVHDRKYEVKRFNRLEDVKACHLLYISVSEHDQLSQIVEHLKGQNILTVNEDSRFTRLGGMINFVVRENKVRFEINGEAAQKANLKINSQLLRLAVSVKTAER